jgi:hypothetical protein
VAHDPGKIEADLALTLALAGDRLADIADQPRTRCPQREDGGLAVVKTKSRAGRRVIGMPAQLMAWLSSHQTVQENERELAADM